MRWAVLSEGFQQPRSRVVEVWPWVKNSELLRTRETLARSSVSVRSVACGRFGHVWIIMQCAFRLPHGKPLEDLSVLLVLRVSISKITLAYRLALES